MLGVILSVKVGLRIILKAVLKLTDLLLATSRHKIKEVVVHPCLIHDFVHPARCIIVVKLRIEGGVWAASLPKLTPRLIRCVLHSQRELTRGLHLTDDVMWVFDSFYLLPLHQIDTFKNILNLLPVFLGSR